MGIQRSSQVLPFPSHTAALSRSRSGVNANLSSRFSLCRHHAAAAHHPTPTPPSWILISNRCMRTLALIKIPTNPEYEPGFLSVKAADTVVATSFRIGSQVHRTWIKKATLLGRLRARPGDIANHLLIKFETNCVMIDLPSLAMQNIMLPSLYASWAYCWLWQTEKKCPGDPARCQEAEGDAAFKDRRPSQWRLNGASICNGDSLQRNQEGKFHG